MKSSAIRFYQQGLRFECTGCGECCKTRGGHAYVYVTRKERRRLAEHLGLPTRSFTARYCEKTDGLFHLRDPASTCQFLDGVRCTVYAARPEQCRTWPFWPENMNARAWKTEVQPGCPGVGIGKLHSRGEIEQVLDGERARLKNLLHE